MDPVLVTVIFKGIGLILCLIFGFGIAYLGFLLFKDGAGLGRDKIAFKVGKVEVQAYSVGSVVMATAFMWAGLGVLISPNIQKTGTDYIVTSFKVEGIDATIPSFSMLVSAESSEEILGNEKSLAAIFAAGFEESSIIDRILINGKIPVYYPNSIQTIPVEGTIRVTTTLGGSASAALVSVSFAPEYNDGLLTFTPFGIQPTEQL